MDKNIGNFTYYFINIGLTGSIYSTIAISIERCLRVYQPINHHSAWNYFCPLVAIVLLYNAPKLLEKKYCFVNGTLQASQFDWAMSKAYEEYHMFTSLIALSVIPTLMIFIFNGLILYKICFKPKANLNSSSSQKIVHRKDTFKVLFLVVSTFVMCHLLRITYMSLLLFWK